MLVWEWERGMGAGAQAACGPAHDLRASYHSLCPCPPAPLPTPTKRAQLAEKELLAPHASHPLTPVGLRVPQHLHLLAPPNVQASHLRVKTKKGSPVVSCANDIHHVSQGSSCHC